MPPAGSAPAPRDRAGYRCREARARLGRPPPHLAHHRYGDAIDAGILAHRDRTRRGGCRSRSPDRWCCNGEECGATASRSRPPLEGRARQDAGLLPRPRPPPGVRKGQELWARRQGASSPCPTAPTGEGEAEGKGPGEGIGENASANRLFSSARRSRRAWCRRRGCGERRPYVVPPLSGSGAWGTLRGTRRARHAHQAGSRARASATSAPRRGGEARACAAFQGSARITARRGAFLGQARKPTPRRWRRR